MKSIELVYKSSDIVSVTKDVSNVPGNLIQDIYAKFPLYNECGVQVGYSVATDVVQQYSEDKFVIIANFIFVLDNLGTINFQYILTRPDNIPLLPIGVTSETRIVNGSGKFVNSTGLVKINPKPDGTRLVLIEFDKCNLLPII